MGIVVLQPDLHEVSKYYTSEDSGFDLNQMKENLIRMISSTTRSKDTTKTIESKSETKVRMVNRQEKQFSTQ